MILKTNYSHLKDEGGGVKEKQMIKLFMSKPKYFSSVGFEFHIAVPEV